MVLSIEGAGVFVVIISHHVDFRAEIDVARELGVYGVLSAVDDVAELFPILF